ncbi:hypothetical protein [Streptomyces sp. NPDC091268]|uniref:hypothetical protein n=1 Tax=Streptomyces sp. NPDC091268 TaxID=3365979 RepID=UPI0037FF430E
MNINVDPAAPEGKDLYEIGPLTYRQGYISVRKEVGGQREDALMHDRALLAVFTGTPAQGAATDQLFRAWVDANELPSVLAHWAAVLH